MKHLRPAFALLALFTLLLGYLYPLAVTGVGRVAFPFQASGSLLTQNDYVVGSALIGQSFTQDKYFWPRPAYPLANPYLFVGSSGSNLALSDPTLKQHYQERITRLDAAHKPFGPAPSDMVTASASGLDPDISPEAALYQTKRIATARNIDSTKVDALVKTLTEDRTLGFMGQPRVNVLRLNLALDALDRGHAP